MKIIKIYLETISSRFFSIGLLIYGKVILAMCKYEYIDWFDGNIDPV